MAESGGEELGQGLGVTAGRPGVHLRPHQLGGQARAHRIVERHRGMAGVVHHQNGVGWNGLAGDGLQTAIERIGRIVRQDHRHDSPIAVSHVGLPLALGAGGPMCTNAFRSGLRLPTPTVQPASQIRPPNIAVLDGVQTRSITSSIRSHEEYPGYHSSEDCR